MPHKPPLTKWMVNGKNEERVWGTARELKDIEMCVSLSLTVNSAWAGGFEKEENWTDLRGGSCTGWDVSKAKRWDRGTSGGQGSLSSEGCLTNKCLSHSSNLGKYYTHLEVSNTECWPPAPRFSFNRSSVGPKKAFPGLQVMVVWGPYFVNHNFLFSPSNLFIFKPVDIFTQLILSPKVFPICV